MEKSGGEIRKGFTIIEVSLVLALAGLLFMMVFIALPALQASERDSERREDITMLLKRIKDYQTANRGALPTEEKTGIVYVDDINAGKGITWQAFYQNYLGESFQDPSGGNYVLDVVKCGDSTVNLGMVCTTGVIDKGQVKNLEPGAIRVVLQASCEYNENEGVYTAVKSSNPRKVATLINLEGGGAYCSSS